MVVTKNKEVIVFHGVYSRTECEIITWYHYTTRAHLNGRMLIQG